MRWTSFGRTIGKNRPGIDRQPSSYSHSPATLDDHRVDEGARPEAVVEVVHEQALLDADLGSGEPEAGHVVHGLDHVVDQTDERAVDVGDVGGTLLEHGVAVDADGVGHGGRQGTVHASYADPRARPATTTSPSDPSSPSRPASVALALPDLTLRRSPPTVVCSRRARVDPGTKLLLSEATAVPERRVDLARPRVRLRADRHHSRPAGAGGDGVGGRRERTGAGPRRRERRRARASADRVRAVAPDDVPADLRFAAIWSNPPIRIGKVGAARSSARPSWLVTADDPAAARYSSSRSTSARTRWPRGSDTGVRRSTGRVSRMGYRHPGGAAGRHDRTDRGNPPRRHRGQAAPPRVASAHRATDRPAARRRADARTTWARSSGRRRLVPDRPTPDRRRPAHHPDHQKSRKTSLGTERLVPWQAIDDVADGTRLGSSRRLRDRWRRARATAAGPCRDRIVPSARVCVSSATRTAACRRGALAVCDRGRLRPDAGQGRLAQRRHRALDRPLRGAAAGVDRSTPASEPAGVDLDS